MTSPIRSTKNKKRKVFKSPQRIPIEVEFESKESAYADPVDSNRTLSMFFFIIP